MSVKIDDLANKADIDGSEFLVADDSNGTKDNIKVSIRQILDKAIAELIKLDSFINKANKATTLAGYGITDAYTRTETDNKIAAGKVAEAKKLTQVCNLTSNAYPTGWFKLMTITYPAVFSTIGATLHIAQRYQSPNVHYDAIVTVCAYSNNVGLYPHVEQIAGRDITDKLQWVIDENGNFVLYVYKTQHNILSVTADNTVGSSYIVFHDRDYTTRVDNVESGTFATYYSQPLAQKAIADADGNDIPGTYVKKTGGEIIIKTPVDLEFTTKKQLNSIGVIVDTPNNYYMAVSRYIDVVVGEQYEICARNNWSSSIYAFYDEDYTLISNKTAAGTSEGTTLNEVVTVPEGATKMLISAFLQNLTYVNKITYEYKDESYKASFPLYNKSVLSFGDSIANGSDTNNIKSYAHIITKNNNMPLLTFASGGATMAVVSGSANNISAQVDTAISYNSAVDFDFVLLEGGTNDVGTSSIQLGDIIDGYDVSTCDNTTFTGALEINISKIRNVWWSANIIYILVHRMTTRNAEKQDQFHDRIIEVCNKWGIPYVDIYNNGQMMSNLEVLLNNCFTDATHPNTTGYEKFYVPSITSKMKELVRD